MNVRDIEAADTRQTEAGVSPMFVRRWSPRAMSGEAVTDAQLDALFEAARWAPSCFNAQPWRFIVSRRDEPGFARQLDLLMPGNQAWAGKAGALVTIVSRNRFEESGEQALTNSFDAGAAWMSIALQAVELGLVAHGMRGFDKDAARPALGVPEEFDVEVMFAIGQPGDIEDLPEAYQEREAPSPRKPLGEIVMRDVFVS